MAAIRAQTLVPVQTARREGMDGQIVRKGNRERGREDASPHRGRQKPVRGRVMEELTGAPAGLGKQLVDEVFRRFAGRLDLALLEFGLQVGLDHV